MMRLFLISLFVAFATVVYAHNEQLFEDLDFEGISTTNKCPIYCNCLDKTTVNTYINTEADEKCIAHFALEFVLDKKACPLKRFTLGLPVDRVEDVIVTEDSCIAQILAAPPADHFDCNSSQNYGDFTPFFFIMNSSQACQEKALYKNNPDEAFKDQLVWRVEFNMPGLKLGRTETAPLHLYGGFHCNSCVLEGIILPTYYEPECTTSEDCGGDPDDVCSSFKCVDHSLLVNGSYCGGQCVKVDIPGCFQNPTPSCEADGSCDDELLASLEGNTDCLSNPRCISAPGSNETRCQFNVQIPCFDANRCDEASTNLPTPADRDAYCQSLFNAWYNVTGVNTGDLFPGVPDYSCTQNWKCLGDEFGEGGNPDGSPSFPSFCRPGNADADCCSQIPTEDCSGLGYESCCEACENHVGCIVSPTGDSNVFTCGTNFFNQETCAGLGLKGTGGSDGDEGATIAGAVGGTLGFAALILICLVIIAIFGACIGIIAAVSLFVWGFKKTRRTLRNLEALGFTPEEARLITSSPVYDHDTGAPNPLFATHDRLGGGSS